MSAAVIDMPRRPDRQPATAAAAWDRYNTRRADIAARWPNVGVEDLRTLVRLYDEACAALEAER